MNETGPLAPKRSIKHLIYLMLVFSGRYCGTTIPHPVTSFGSALSVNFISNDANTAKGFHAIVAASTSGKPVSEYS